MSYFALASKMTWPVNIGVQIFFACSACKLFLPCTLKIIAGPWYVTKLIVCLAHPLFRCFRHLVPDCWLQTWARQKYPKWLRCHLFGCGLIGALGTMYCVGAWIPSPWEGSLQGVLLGNVQTCMWSIFSALFTRGQESCCLWLPVFCSSLLSMLV